MRDAEFEQVEAIPEKPIELRTGDLIQSCRKMRRAGLTDECDQVGVKAVSPLWLLQSQSGLSKLRTTLKQGRGAWPRCPPRASEGSID